VNNPVAVAKLPKAEPSICVACEFRPTAVLLMPVAVAWQLALESRLAFATLPELHSARAGAERPSVKAIAALESHAARPVLPCGSRYAVAITVSASQADLVMGREHGREAARLPERRCFSRRLEARENSPAR
jgi:hypothetical protein